MHVHRARPALVLRAPDLVQQAVAVESLFRVLHQVAQKFELAEGEHDLFPVRLHGVLLAVEADAAQRQHALAAPGAAADDRLDAGDQLHHAKGLGHIVVRAALQPLDLVGLLALGGDHDDGDGAEARVAAQTA